MWLLNIKHIYMELLSKVGSYDFLVEPFHCDFSNRIFIGHLGNHLLNAADFHSNERGYGMDYLNPINRTWVLSRFVMEMDELPLAYDRIIVDTWVENVMKFFTSRNFAIRSAHGKVYGYGRSIWAMIDTQTRQPVNILGLRDGLITEYIETDKACPIRPFQRVRLTDKAECKRTVVMQYSDVDVNGHVNSVKYIEHMLNMWGLDWYKSNSLHRIDIAYVAESHYGDTLHFVVEEESEGVFCILVQKLTLPAADDLKEVCRGKIEFKKR